MPFKFFTSFHIFLNLKMLTVLVWKLHLYCTASNQFTQANVYLRNPKNTTASTQVVPSCKLHPACSL